MKPGKAINAIRGSFEPLSETFADQIVKPMAGEAMDELLGFMGNDAFARKSSLAQEDLKRAREQKKLEELSAEDSQRSHQIIESIRVQYESSERARNKEDGQVHQEIEELTVQVVELAKTAGVESKIHLQSTSRRERVSILTLKLLRAIIRTLTLKAKEAKSASELVSHRSNAKTTGMLAWVSGKQMKIHEQGTMQLQG